MAMQQTALKSQLAEMNGHAEATATHIKKFLQNASVKICTADMQYEYLKRILEDVIAKNATYL